MENRTTPTGQWRISQGPSMYFTKKMSYEKVIFWLSMVAAPQGVAKVGICSAQHKNVFAQVSAQTETTSARPEKKYDFPWKNA